MTGQEMFGNLVDMEGRGRKKIGRPPSVLEPDVARKVLQLLGDNWPYSEIAPRIKKSTKWLSRAHRNGRLREMAAGAATAEAEGMNPSASSFADGTKPPDKIMAGLPR